MIEAATPQRVADDRAPLLRRFAPESFVPIAAGLVWLLGVGAQGIAGLAVAALPGALLLGAGVAMLVWPGDLRIPQFTAVGGALGAPLAIAAIPIAGPLAALGLALLSAGSFLVAGLNALRREPRVEEVPDPLPGVGLCAKVALDEALIATLVMTVPMPGDRDARRLRAESDRALALWHERGWLEKPAAYHREPPPLEAVRVRERRAGRLRFEQLSFESGYAPRPEEPGVERLVEQPRNATAHAWLLRHPGPARPWLVCVHGYGMGAPGIDLRVFEAERLHSGLGLNVALPLLPDHGPRSGGRRSGRRFLTADFVQSVHVQAQAVWDVRRLLSWVRAQGADRVGLYGISMGGHVAALVASLDGELDRVVCGIPVADLARIAWRHGPRDVIARFELLGLPPSDAEALLRVVSPLALEPRVAHEARYLFGATADRVVPPDHVRDLWRHWERPRLAWYEGSHLSFPHERPVRELLADAFGGLSRS